MSMRKACPIKTRSASERGGSAARCSAFGPPEFRSVAAARLATRSGLSRHILPFAHIRTSRVDLFGTPQVPRAGASGPDRGIGANQAGRAECSRGVRLKLHDHLFGAQSGAPDNDVNLVGSNRQLQQRPGANLAAASNRCADEPLRRFFERDRAVQHSVPGVRASEVARFQHRRRIAVAPPIDRAALIAVKPHAVRAPSQEIRQRRVDRIESYAAAEAGGSPACCTTRSLALRVLIPTRDVRTPRSLALRVLIAAGAGGPCG